MVDLLFREPLTPWQGHVDLVLGGEPGGPVEGPRDVRLRAVLPPPRTRIRVARYYTARLRARLAPPRARFKARYDNDVLRGVSVATQAPWEATDQERHEAGAPWADAPERRAEPGDRWQPAAPLDTALAAPYRALPRERREPATAWERAAAVATHRGSGYAYPPRLALDHHGRWQRGRRASTQAGGTWAYPGRAGIRRTAAWQPAAPFGIAVFAAPFGPGIYAAPRWHGRWERAGYPLPGESMPPDPPDPPGPDPHVPDTDLLFRCPMPSAPWGLIFADHPCPPPGGGIVVPRRRVYVVLNTAELVRLSDGATIPTTGLSAAIDVDSWAWELSATLAGADAVQLIHEAGGAPIDVEARINGHAWRGVIDDWTHDREFGRRNVRLRARSLAAYLAAPYALPRAYTETAERTAVQLAEQELPTGWTLDWQLVDWLVPAGVWSYADRTPMAAITTLAEAVGGIIQADPAAQTLHARPRYPAAHWEWDTLTPDVSLPADVLVSLGTQPQPKQAANRVYVSGKHQGVSVGVTREGTAGNIALPEVIEALITDVAAGRARGLAELSATGWQARERLALPLSPNTGGLITPGALLEVTNSDHPPTWRGLVRSTAIEARLADTGMTVRQTLEAERHEEEAAA
ncbi:hypothetical protein [Arhodomonas sp. AD133]|uniref:hypothetical protein n=1 Tax=Arhodomonas sp. AD133 TaxID=3415009 RepID=UPI003EBEB9E2